MIDHKLLDYCETDWQRECIQASIDHGNYTQAAKVLESDRKRVGEAVARVKKRAARQGYSPEHDLNRPIPDGYQLKGTSTLYDDTGAQRLQWVKTTIDQERQLEIYQHLVQSFSEDIKPTRPVNKSPEPTHEKLLSIYPVFDLHLGLYAWAAEAGADFDVQIARHDLMAAIDHLVDCSPPSSRGLLINGGDFYHAENMRGITEKSGNVLDMDTRFYMMVDIGVDLLRRCIHRMLEKHDTVEVVNVPGNHDETMSPIMDVMMKNVYEREPRVTIHASPRERKYIEHGSVAIGVTHGHKTRDAELPGVMATEQPELWGRTRHRFFFRGHDHHDERREFNGCIVEHFRKLSAADAHEVGLGYLSGRDMKCIVMHSDRGEGRRFTCGIDVVRDAA